MSKLVIPQKKPSVRPPSESELEPPKIPRVSKKPSVRSPPPDEEETEPEPEEVYLPGSKIKPRPRCTCRDCCGCCRDTFKCTNFPACCKYPLILSLQLIIAFDMLVVILTLSLSIVLEQADPLQARLYSIKRNTLGNASNSNDSTPAPTVTPAGRKLHSPHLHDFQDYDEVTFMPDKMQRAQIGDPNDVDFAELLILSQQFAESTTVLGQPLFPDDIDAELEARRYSKIAYYNLKNLQQVGEQCGSTYYVDHLYDLRLNRTQKLFKLIIRASYFSEFAEFIIDICFLITTCCFYAFSSARVFLIILWIVELLPNTMKLWIVVASWSQSMCIFEYGTKYRGLTMFAVLHVPLVLFRIYKKVVFSYFIHSMFTQAGHLTHKKKVEGVTLKEYRQKQVEYLTMDRNRDDTSSGSDL